MTGKELSIKNLRILTFGDTHGRSVWKDVIDKEGIENLDLIIFLGDYFTSREDISVERQEENFRNIVLQKNRYFVSLKKGKKSHSYVHFLTKRCWK